MDEREFRKIVGCIVERGLEAMKENAGGEEAVIDYVAIFAKDAGEYRDLEAVAESLGKEVDKETATTGRTFLLKEPMETAAGRLELVKVRRPDATRPQRGAPDFKVKDYWGFKERYLKGGRNLTLMVRDDYEMIEIKGVDVLVYVPSEGLSERV